MTRQRKILLAAAVVALLTVPGVAMASGAFSIGGDHLGVVDDRVLTADDGQATTTIADDLSSDDLDEATEVEDSSDDLSEAAEADDSSSDDLDEATEVEDSSDDLSEAAETDDSSSDDLDEATEVEDSSDDLDDQGDDAPDADDMVSLHS